MKNRNFRKKAVITALLPLLASTIVNAEIQSSAKNQSTANINSLTALRGGGIDVLLWDQSVNTPNGSMPDQDFEAAYDSYDTEVADDFVISDPGGWIINEVRMVGSHNDFLDENDNVIGQGGPTQTVSISFYEDNAGLPAATPVTGCSFTGLATDDQLDAQNDPSGTLFTIIPGGCQLAPGTYWVSHQAQQDFATNNQHFIRGSSDGVTGSEAVFINPGDGFGSGCTASFGAAATTCGMNSGTPFDLTFVMFGEILAGSSDADLNLTKTNDIVGQASLNDTVNYTLSTTNIEAGAATNVVLTDSLPTGITYVSSSCDDGTNGSLAGSTVTFNLNDVAPAATTVCTIVATVSDYGDQVNNASIAADNDIDTTNNDATSTVTGPVEVDLSIAKTSDAVGQLATNDTLIYTLTVTNTDVSNAASNVVVTDMLPTQVTYVSNDCGASEAAGTVTWNQASLAAGANAACNITTTVTGFGTFDNTTNVSADEDDSNMSNNSSTISVDGPVAAAGVDVQITKTSDAVGTLGANEAVVFTLAVSNLDLTNTANNVVVTDALPSGLSYTSNSCGASVSGSTVTWNVGVLAPSASASCDVSTTMTGFGFVENTASATSDEPDNNSTNNSSSTTVEGPVAIDLSLTKSATAADPLFVGSMITYTLTASNINTGDATGVVVTDSLPSQVSYVSNSCGASQAGGVVTWNIGNMNSGAISSCDIMVTVNSEGSINNTASISSNESDVVGGNNSGSAGVFVGAPIIIPSLNWAGLLILILSLGFFGRRLVKQ